MSVRLLKIAVVYFVLGGVLGLGMGITEKFTLTPIHAHLLLAGWASLALAGLIYHVHPQASETGLARAHFWLHNLGLPFFMVALAMFLSGNASAGPLIPIGATALLTGLICFAANVLMNVKPAR